LSLARDCPIKSFSLTQGHDMSAAMDYTSRYTCRVCGSRDLNDVFSLGNLYVSDFPAHRTSPAIRAPLDLVLCSGCSLLQLRHTAPQELMYTRHYWYRSGITHTMRAALRDIARSAEDLVALHADDIVLDIGANDGTLLAAYNTPGLIKVGCEPANNLVAELREVTPHIIHDFWRAEAFDALFPGKKAKVVTAIGMFYDMEDPNQFVADAARVLDENGIFIAQLMCLRPMLEKNDLGNICHEHLEFYSLESLKVLFENNGLEVFKLEENNINGGSYRIFCRRLRSGSIRLADNFTTTDYLAFFNRVNAIRSRCQDFIRSEVGRGKKVYVYGASTKGNTILQYFGLTAESIAGAADRSPEKWGRFTVGTLIPIVSEEAARTDADYFLVLPWAFLDEFLERESDWRKRGGKFIVPFPEFRIL
jgi:NDP-4-keto-2,6-dideoxyhexose 3-C-methyltransferase